MRFPVVGLAERAGDDCCEFALCQAPIDFAVTLPKRETMKVCSVHVNPVILWGWTDEDDDFPEVRAIAS